MKEFNWPNLSILIALFGLLLLAIRKRREITLFYLGFSHGKKNFPESNSEIIEKLPGQVERIKQLAEKEIINLIQVTNLQHEKIKILYEMHPEKLTGLCKLIMSIVFLLFAIFETILVEKPFQIFNWDMNTTLLISLVFSVTLLMTEILALRRLPEKIEQIFQNMPWAIIPLILILIAVVRILYLSETQQNTYANVLSGILLFLFHIVFAINWLKLRNLAIENSKTKRQQDLIKRIYSLKEQAKAKADQIAEKNQKLINLYCSVNEFYRSDGAKFSENSTAIMNPADSLLTI